MAVPKKRTSKSKKNLRKTVWKKKALKSAIQAYFLADSIFKKEIVNDNNNVTMSKGFKNDSEMVLNSTRKKQKGKKSG